MGEGVVVWCDVCLCVVCACVCCVVCMLWSGCVRVCMYLYTSTFVYIA